MSSNKASKAYIHWVLHQVFAQEVMNTSRWVSKLLLTKGQAQIIYVNPRPRSELPWVGYLSILSRPLNCLRTEWKLIHVGQLSIANFMQINAAHSTTTGVVKLFVSQKEAKHRQLVFYPQTVENGKQALLYILIFTLILASPREDDVEATLWSPPVIVSFQLSWRWDVVSHFWNSRGLTQLLHL